MFILSTIDRIARAYRSRRLEARTIRAIGALPEEIRKDIGWPEGRDVNGARASMRMLSPWHL